MEFSLQKSLEILERTPAVLHSLLSGISDEWTLNNEGEGTWEPFNVLGHLIHGEKTDWISRMKHILELGSSEPFVPFDMNAHFRESQGKTLNQLLDEFAHLRHENMQTLKNTPLDKEALSKKGAHPALGTVTLLELLACWTVHDLGHIAQVSRVMARQYSDQVGPWIAYLGILKPTLLSPKMVQIIDYQPVHFLRWKAINEAWITRAYFMEEIDHLHCSQPEESILAGGGFILLAQMGSEIAGTAGLIRDDEDTYELIKMAVDERFRGHRIGLLLCEAAIEKAKSAGAKLLYLFSNTKGSATAIQIYRDLGFVEVPLDRNDFVRADIRMEMHF